MIDAYEIGIRLLLQDDVSAGLAVISEGLAEVDRGIAATSAHLTALVHESEVAAKAVAAVVGKTITPAPSQPAAADAARSNAPKAGQEPRVAAVPAGTTPEVAVVRETPVGRDATPRRDGEPRRTSDAPMPAVPAVAAERDSARRSDEAPTASVVPTLVVTAPNSLPAAAKPLRSDGAEPARGVQQAPVAPAVELPVRPSKPVEAAVPVAASVAPREPSRSDAAATVTASVASSRAELPQRLSTAAAVARDAQAIPERGRPAAPDADMGGVGKAKEPSRSSERSSAPSSQARERSDSVGGAVMLDGRLVGQWLSDHMAQEASRPPGGTSFFDPRQTPAWTISGAI